MSTPKRTITIDTSIQSLYKRGKNKSVKNTSSANTIRPKLKTNQFIRPSTLKKQLLARIKTHQQKSATTATTATTRTTLRDNVSSLDTAPKNTPADNKPDSESFSQSLEYLQSLAVNRRDHKQKTKTHRVANTITTAPHQQHPHQQPQQPQQQQQPQQPQQPQQQQQPQVILTAFPSESVGMQETAHMNVAPIMQFPPQTSLGGVAIATPSYINDNNSDSIPVVLNSEPQWGCLKSGNKPTFRSFHNKTCKISTSISPESSGDGIRIQSDDGAYNSSSGSGPSIVSSFGNNNNNNNNNSESVPDTNIIDNASDSETEKERDCPDPVSLSEVLYGSRQQRLNDYRNEQVKNDKKNIEPVIKIKQTRQRVVTKRYKLGKYTNKTGPVIGVLIKNVQTQRNVERKRNEMKHIPLDTIISRLHKKRLLKVGSSAPPDVLREMYESSMLAGDIENEGNDIALHNFLAGSTDNNDTTSS